MSYLKSLITLVLVNDILGSVSSNEFKVKLITIQCSYNEIMFKRKLFLIGFHKLEMNLMSVGKIYW